MLSHFFFSVLLFCRQQKRSSPSQLNEPLHLDFSSRSRSKNMNMSLNEGDIAGIDRLTESIAILVEAQEKQQKSVNENMNKLLSLYSKPVRQVLVVLVSILVLA